MVRPSLLYHIYYIESRVGAIIEQDSSKQLGSNIILIGRGTASPLQKGVTLTIEAVFFRPFPKTETHTFRSNVAADLRHCAGRESCTSDIHKEGLELVVAI